MVKWYECLSCSIVAVALSLPSATALAQASADDANKSNNPLNPAPGLNAQDWLPARRQLSHPIFFQARFLRLARGVARSGF